MSRVAPCPFCGVAEGRLLFREALVSALWDAFPVSQGHALIVPNRHIAGWSEATEAERTALTASIERVRDLLRDRYSPDGFNVGFNDGEAAGQTVPHLHVHVIPRYTGGRPRPDRRRPARHPCEGELPPADRPGLSTAGDRAAAATGRRRRATRSCRTCCASWTPRPRSTWRSPSSSGAAWIACWPTSATCSPAGVRSAS